MQIWVLLYILIIRKKDILVLGREPTQGCNKKEFFLSLHDNGGNSYLFVNGTEIC